MWVKSSYSSKTNCLEWRKSSHSSHNGQCVEVAPGVEIRDSTLGDGTVLRVPDGAWRAFIARLRAASQD